MTQVDSGKLQIDEVVPGFALQSLDGRTVSPRDYKQRANLVIAYMDFDRCSACTKTLRTFADGYAEYRELETEIIVVSPQAVPDLRGRIGAMHLPFPVLSDPEGKMADAYFGDGEEKVVETVFITDRYGALRARMVSHSTSELPDRREILDWLNLIEMECPECGH